LSAAPRRLELELILLRQRGAEVDGEVVETAARGGAVLHQVRREGARDAPCLQRGRRVHQVEMQVRGGRVPSVADTSQHLAGADPLASGDDDDARGKCAYSV
jgi:hypothetical protein